MFARGSTASSSRSSSVQGFASLAPPRPIPMPSPFQFALPIVSPSPPPPAAPSQNKASAFGLVTAVADNGATDLN